jgi:DNA (cytosine-5)-methyltransferase 1
MRALDLYCCAGGAAVGLHRAGYDVTGVDIEAQPHYPFAFIRGDALEAQLSGYDFVWASPPCQRYSRMSGCREGLSDTYPGGLIAATRAKLEAWGGPWVIENVVGAPLRDPVMLCGAMFGLKTYRHRIFESNLPLTVPEHPEHSIPASKAGHWKPGTFISVAGNCAPMAMAREAMGINWRMPRSNLVEAIPPAFAEYLARQILSLGEEVVV